MMAVFGTGTALIIFEIIRTEALHQMHPNFRYYVGSNLTDSFLRVRAACKGPFEETSRSLGGIGALYFRCQKAR